MDAKCHALSNVVDEGKEIINVINNITIIICYPLITARDGWIFTSSGNK
jgi:hypothetical protein